MGHRYYLWARQKNNTIPFTITELLNGINKISPSLMNSESSFMFISANETNKVNGQIIKISSAYKRMVSIRTFNEETMQFENVKVSDWKDAVAYWYLDENIIEIRGGSEIAEKFMDEIASLFMAYFDFSPMIISKKAFEYIMKNRIQKITEKSFKLEDGEIVIKGKQYIYLAETKAIKELLSKKDVYSTIRGVYYLSTNLETALYPIPVIISQEGKIQFIKLELTKMGLKRETYERITNDIVRDILSIIKKSK